MMPSKETEMPTCSLCGRSSEPLTITCNSLCRPYKYSYLPVLHCPVPRATAALSQLPPFDIVSRTKLVTRAGNIIRLRLLLMAEQLTPTPCASPRRHLGLRLPWYQWMWTWTWYLLWSLCTWGVQVRPPIPVWNKNNSVAKRNAPSLLLCCFKFSDPVVKQAICIKLTVLLGKDTLR